MQNLGIIGDDLELQSRAVSWHNPSATLAMINGNYERTDFTLAAWNAGASDINRYRKGRLTFQAVDHSTGTAPNGQQCMFGASILNPDTAFTAINFAFYIGAGVLYIYELGAQIGSYGAIVTGDTLTIDWNDVEVKYYFKGNLIRTIVRNTAGALGFDCSIYAKGCFKLVAYEGAN